MRVRDLRVSYVSRDRPCESYIGSPIRNPRDAAAVFLPLFGNEIVEILALLCPPVPHMICSACTNARAGRSMAFWCTQRHL